MGPVLETSVNRKRELRSLADVREAVDAALRRLLESAGPGKPLIRVSSREGRVVLAATLSSLERRNVRIEVEDDALTFWRHASAVKVALGSFRTLTSLRRGVLEVVVLQRSPERAFALLPQSAKDAPAETWQAVARVLTAATSPMRTVFVTRALNAVARLSAEAGEESLVAASASQNDYPVLVRALEDARPLAVMREEDPLAPARLRGITARQKLLDAAGGTLSADEVGKLLGITRQAVDKRRRSGKLLALELARRGYAYTAFQFTEDRTLSGLEQVLERLRDHDSWMQLAFFVSRNLHLGNETPIAHIRRGRIEDVLAAAEMYGEHGAA